MCCYLYLVKQLNQDQPYRDPYPYGEYTLHLSESGTYYILLPDRRVSADTAICFHPFTFFQMEHLDRFIRL